MSYRACPQRQTVGSICRTTFSWTKHVEHIAQKATKRLYFLKVLKRSGLPSDHFLHFYVAVIWPVLEYCCCIWHHNITNKLSLHIEAIQKQAMKIIFECTQGMSYANSLYLAELSSLQHCGQQQARDFFQSLLNPNSCLHSLLPAARDQNLVARLRAARQFPALASRTKKCQSYINFGFLNCHKSRSICKSVVQLYLYYFYSFMFTLVMHRFMHNCICTFVVYF